MSKFSGINYPFFGLTRKPSEIVYTLDKIYIKKYLDSHLETVDDKNIQGDYFYRLLHMGARVKFDYTCKNLQDIITSRVRWGVDCKAIPHDLSEPEYVTTEKRKVTRVTGNLVWIRNISYPFRLSTNESVSILDDLYATIIKIDNEWYIKEFTYDKELKRSVTLL